MLNLSIWPIDMNKSSATTPGLSGRGRDRNERYSAFLQTPALLDTHDQIV